MAVVSCIPLSRFSWAASCCVISVTTFLVNFVYWSLPEIKFVSAAAADAHDAVYLNCSDKQQHYVYGHLRSVIKR